jgi:hypothetical protein
LLGKFPAGGMSSIQRAVKSELTRVVKLIDDLEYASAELYEVFVMTLDTEIAKQLYEDFVYAFVVGLYAFMFQGRTAAVLNLTLNNVEVIY